MNDSKLSWMIAASLILSICASELTAQQRIQDICRVKGQEENSLRGVGLVVGLNGTGDPNLRSTSRALARMLATTGIPLPKDIQGRDLIEELKDVKNVALVFVTATVPAAGARQGDKLNCAVHAFGNAKSLEGGHLLMAPLLGGLPTDDPAQQRIYAYCEGSLHTANPKAPLTAKIHNGCRLEVSFNNQFAKNGYITLVLDKDHANFHTAHAIARLINTFPEFRYQDEKHFGEDLAIALDQVNVLIRIPENYKDHHVQFVSAILEMSVVHLKNDARVVISGNTVVIGENVVIDPVAVTHKNFSVEAGPFFPLDPNPTQSDVDSRKVKLRSLVDALNALQATPQDVIDIIKTLKRSGNLYGDVIVE